MRHLTIKRAKSFVACLMKAKVYIEDPSAGEMVINGLSCRRLGELKNGEEKTFQIGEGEAKVFVIFDQLSKDFCNDYYQLPAGQEDIVLTGKNKYNLAAGNAFRFDNNDSAEVTAHRKKGTRKGLVVLIIAALIGVALGILNNIDVFFPNDPEEKTFTAEGMSITLTDEFTKVDNSTQYTVAYGSREVAVFAIKEDFTLAEGFEDYTLEQYGELVLSSNELDDTKLEYDGEMLFFKYNADNPEAKVTFQYFSYMYKADDAFWLIQFAVDEASAAEYAPQISQWAKSVTFGN